MKHRSLLFVAALSVCLSIVLVQDAKAQLIAPLCVPQPQADMPSWAQHLYDVPLNIFRVDSAFQEYYQRHEFVKDNYTKYYKRLRRISTPFIQSDGFIPEVQSRDVLRSESKHFNTTQSLTAVQWKAIGPLETYFPASATKEPQLCPWQCNVYAFDISASNPNILYAVSETGGFFKSTNKGQQWTMLEPGVYSNSEAVAIHPGNPDIVYVGISGGLLRTSDGGATWKSIWSVNGLAIYDLEVNATQTSILYAATNLGFYVSTNAGVSWTKSLTNTCSDLETNVNNRNEVYTLRQDSTKKLYEFWKSTDAGASFSRRSTGWLKNSDSSSSGRMTVSAADPNRIYIVLLGTGNSSPYILRSDDAGETWKVTVRGESDSLRMTNGQGYYDLSIAASATDANVLMVGSTTAYRSTNGGFSFPTVIGGYSGLFPIHPDIQEMKCKGNDCYIATDGGFNYSSDLFATNCESRTVGLNGADFWGFDAGWNEDVLVGGRYHNGNTAWSEGFGSKFLRMGGGEASTGYVNPMQSRQTFFSDIGAYDIPNDINGKLTRRASSIYPNESYFNMEYSEMQWDPRCYRDVWIGNANNLLLSHNNGESYQTVWTSPDTGAVIQHIEICRSNPDVIYVSQRSNVLYDGKIWKTTNAGQTWAALSAFPNTKAGERRVMRICASGKSDKILFAALYNGSKSNKVFKSSDGGNTWINLTSSVIENTTITDIVYQYGTDDGVYIAATNGRVFYRNATMSDWVLHGSGLPYALITRSLKPFYRDSKLRTGSTLGIWEAPLYEHSKPEAQPCVDKRSTSCERDTFHFDDYSVLERASARWQWSFPGASWVSDSTIRNPTVLYNKSGQYSVSLKVSNDYGSDTKTITKLISVNPSECDIDSVAGRALDLGSSTDLATIPALAQFKNAPGLSVSCWLKLDTIQSSFSQILSNWSSDVGFSLGFSFQGYKANTNLTFYWKNVPYQLTSPFNLSVGDWVHVAITVDTNAVTLYANGQPWVYKNANADFRHFDLSSTPWEIGGGLPGQGGNYRGQIEELQIFRRVLDSNEVRLRMHLVNERRTHADSIVDFEPVAYFQFNEKNTLQFFNRYGAIHASNSAGVQVTSTAPIGLGSSAHLTVGQGNWDIHDLSISRSDSAMKSIVVTRIESLPDSLPMGVNRWSPTYWIVHSYDIKKALAVDSIVFNRIGAISLSDQNNPSQLKLWKRGANEHRNTWQLRGTAITADSLSSRAGFGSDTNAVAQYIIGTTGSSPLEIPVDTNANLELQLLPNPVSDMATVFLSTSTPATLRVCDMLGRVRAEYSVTSPIFSFSTSQLDDGLYTVQVIDKKRRLGGLLFVRH